MPDMLQKVGLISCSGEDLPCGTVAREATLLVLERLRPHHTVTLCLPLFLAGEERERAFARRFPTLAVDGCAKRCAARATEKYSAAPAASVVVDDLQVERGLPAATRRRGAEPARAALAQVTAEVLAAEVDRLLGRAPDEPLPEADLERPAPPPGGGCACGSGVPTLRLEVQGDRFALLALPAIFDQLARQGVPPDGEATANTLLEQARIYNDLPPEKEPALRERLVEAYRDFCRKREGR